MSAALKGMRNRAVESVAHYLIDSGTFDRWITGLETKSDKDLIAFIRRIARNAARLARFSKKTAKLQRQLEWVAEFMEQPGNSALPIFRRILALHPRVRSRFLTNLGIRGTLIGAPKREEVEQQRGFVPPLFVVISPSMNCNLHCPNCYARGYRGPDLPFKTLVKVCKEMKDELGCGFITLAGGEPFVYRDPKTQETIWDLAAAFPEITFQTYTNVTMLANEKAIEQLMELGNVVPAISVEGFEEDTVARRGQETWDKIMWFMPRAQEAGLLYGVSATATRYNVERLATDAFTDYWIAKGALFAWYFIVIPIGAAGLEAMVLPHQRDALRIFVTEYARKTKPILCFDFWNDGALVDGCIAGGRHCHILNDGRVTACVFSPFAAKGYNVKDQSLLDILQYAPYFQQVRRYQAIRNTNNPLLPCMVIDYPGHLVSAVQEGKGEPAYPGAEKLIEPAMTALLEDKAAAYRPLAEAAWQGGYCWATAKQKPSS